MSNRLKLPAPSGTVSLRLELGDCLERMKDIPRRSVQSVICDLPYGETNAGWDREVNLQELTKQYLRILRGDGTVVLFGSAKFAAKLIAGFPHVYRHSWFWRRRASNFLQSARRPLNVVEQVVVFAATPQYKYRPQMVELEKPITRSLPTVACKLYSEGYLGGVKGREFIKTYTHSTPTDFLEFPFPKSEGRLMPCQKPLELVEYFVKTYTDLGDTVLDNTMGSGTTGVACKSLGRNFHGIEQNRKHYRAACERIRNYEGKGDYIYG